VITREYQDVVSWAVQGPLRAFWPPEQHVFPSRLAADLQSFSHDLSQPALETVLPDMRRAAAVFILMVALAAHAATAPWVLPGDGVPKGTIRITTLGSGTPDIRRHQVASGFLIDLGEEEKLIFDLGSGAYLNLLSTGVPHAQLTKVCFHGTAWIVYSTIFCSL